MGDDGGPTHGSAHTRSGNCGIFWIQEALLPVAGAACALIWNLFRGTAAPCPYMFKSGQRHLRARNEEIFSMTGSHLLSFLRSGATKNLVLGKKHTSVRRTRCFASFSMTYGVGIRCIGMVLGSTDGTLTSNIIGISRSPLHGSLAMKFGVKEPFPYLSLRGTK